MKKLFVFFIFTIGLLGIAKADSIVLCDNYGTTWNLTITGDSLEGLRDVHNLLECGSPYVRGMFNPASVHFVLTSMEGDGDCVAVIWDGIWSGSSGSGTWYNNNGNGTGSFTLEEGGCTGARMESSFEAVDPAK